MARWLLVSLIGAALIISLLLAVRWVRERGSGARIMTQRQTNDCGQWAGMNVKVKKRYYRADPVRWAQCLYAGQDSELDRVYIMGKVSR